MRRYYAEINVWFKAKDDDDAFDLIAALVEELREYKGVEGRTDASLINEVDKDDEVIREGIDTEGGIDDEA